VADRMERKHYGHTRDGEPPKNWQLLEDHLRQTAETARSFAKEARSGDQTYLMGLWYNILNTKNILIA